MRLFVYVLILLLASVASAAAPPNQPSPTQGAGPQPTAPAAPLRQFEELQLRLEKEISQTLDAKSSSMEQRIAGELTAHRDYLQQITDKFYAFFSTWVPIITGVGAVFVGLFLWEVGKSRKEAFESAKAEAVAKAERLAQEKVEATVIPSHIVSTVEKLTEETVGQIRNLKLQLTGQVRQDLEAARDEILQKKHDVIMQALDEAMKEKFSAELDVLDRLERIDQRLRELEKRIGDVDEVMQVEVVRQAVARQPGPLVVDTVPSLKVVQKIAEILARMVLRI